MISVEQWRHRIGGFCPRARKQKHKISTLTLNKHCLSSCAKFFVLVSLLVLAGDIETNPGPGSNTRSGAKTNNDGKEPTLNDVMNAIQGLTATVTDVKTNITTIQTSLQTLTETVTTLRETTDTLQKQYADVSGDLRNVRRHNDILNAQLTEMRQKVENMESHSRRNNLIFNGIPTTKPNESSQDCEETLRSTLAKELKIDMSEIAFERVHRIKTRKSPNPIIAKFTYYKDRESIIKKRASLKGTQIYINEDFTTRVRDIRQKLQPFMKRFREENKVVKLVFDHLYIDGERYDYDPENDTVHKQHIASSPTKRNDPR